jgi:hypothetical protein
MLLFLPFFVVILFCSCGLEVFYYLEPPYYLGYPSTTDPAERTFKFDTADSANIRNGDIYRGTQVYYRIYNSANKMRSDRNSISNRNAEYSIEGFRALERLNYQPMTSPNSSSILLASSSSNRRVAIRLFEEGSADPYFAGLYLGSAAITERVPTASILRYDTLRSFDFKKEGVDLPRGSDSDVEYTSSYGTTVWYIQAYAVAYGMNTTFQAIYSQLLDLGSIEIDTSIP